MMRATISNVVVGDDVTRGMRYVRRGCAPSIVLDGRNRRPDGAAAGGEGEVMPTRIVECRFMTGLQRPLFRNVRLCGSWDNAGRYSDNWTTLPMSDRRGEDGCWS